MPLTPEECTRIVTMLEDGPKQRNTVRTVGATLSTVQRVLQCFNGTGLNPQGPGSGPTKCTTVQEDRYKLSTILRNWFHMTVKKL